MVGALGFVTCADPTNSESESSTEPSGASSSSGEAPVRNYTYEVVNTYPHDSGAYTQGLMIEGEKIFEGTGLRGRSSLRKVDLQTGSVEQIHHLSSSIFGEGIVVYDDKILQLSWTSRIGFIYNKDTFEQLRSVTYPTEGWGITYDGTQFIISDGTANLYFRDKITFEEIDRVTVRDDQGTVTRLNELEYVKGEIYANVWQSDRIARINPANGRVVGWIDLVGLLPPEDHSSAVDVLNGIAYDSVKDRLFVTGKLWPKLFEIKLIEQ
ncbi:MAG TPA: glutaminyl-peptide cyclotransferase [candidate division Zixibacteria bacterium]|nr:glutaminyl-peptide cyclotransferase [candidate division Zixibacteria bacterium]